MLNNPSSNPNKKECEYCGTDRTYIAVTKRGTPYPKWNNNPYKEDTWICGKCYRNLLYHNALPPIHVRRSIRIYRIARRVCHKCGGKTTTQKSKTSRNDYHIWHRHPEVLSKWLCGRCYANWLFEPRRRFETKEERYQYISKLFTGTGNPQYGNHTLNVGRVYTEERNKKVSEAVKKWAQTHKDHYHKMGILGALKARKLGLSGLPTGIEILMEKALKKHKIRYRSQFRYGMGIMDFYLPEGNIALFIDGGVWHADPRSYKPTDTLFFNPNTSRKEPLTAADVWRKDKTHNDYLKSRGYNVVRFWEKEVESKIDLCLEIIKKKIQKVKKYR
jgi:DNA mismatch endonuclease, patch repair protein